MRHFPVLGAVPNRRARRTFRRVRNSAVLLALAVPCGANITLSDGDAVEAEARELFEESVGPILAARCLDCHGGVERRAGLSLATREELLTGGASGPAVVPGGPEASLLLAAVRREPGGLAMPPDRPLDAGEIAALERWIELGAPYGDERITGTWWSFVPVVEPALPEVADASWCSDPLDRFVLARLEQAGLAPAPPAERASWLRRVTFDLTGLPPTLGELDAFLADDSVDADARVVDRLLDSRAYAERFARAWLDIARYADTAGDSSDYPIEDARRYRDWVVDSFAADLPYDRFLAMQVAGDVLAGDASYADGVVATGFLALARRFGVGKDDELHLVREDALDTLGRAALGLGLSCARCHEHPFDPISQEEYYALDGILASTVFPFPGSENEKAPDRLVPLLPPLEVERLLREHADAVAAFEAEAAARAEQLASSESSADSPEPAPEPAKPPRKPRIETAYACQEGQPRDAALLADGNPRRKGDTVPRGFPAALVLNDAPSIDATSGSGRRELAAWLTRPDHPLTARVWSNRVWALLVGRGIVATPSDFGRQGARPTNPELLDWLATQLVADGWSTRALVRRIVLSSTYRQGTAESELDPENDLNARHVRRRLTAEELRDAILLVAGALDTSPAGAHPFPKRKDWKWTQHNPFRELYEHDRRSLYLMVPRLRRHPFLALFDGPETTASHPTRNATISPAQAHFLSNSPWIHEQSERLAKRVLAEAKPNNAARLDHLWRLAYARSPDADEHAVTATFLEDYAAPPDVDAELAAWSALARVVLASNEFLYLD